jgi:hypothetical protein
MDKSYALLGPWLGLMAVFTAIYLLRLTGLEGKVRC